MIRPVALAAARALLAAAPALAEGFDARAAVRSALAAGGPSTVVCTQERASGRVILVYKGR